MLYFFLHSMTQVNLKTHDRYLKKVELRLADYLTEGYLSVTRCFLIWLMRPYSFLTIVINQTSSYLVKSFQDPIYSFFIPLDYASQLANQPDLCYPLIFMITKIDLSFADLRWVKTCFTNQELKSLMGFAVTQMDSIDHSRILSDLISGSYWTLKVSFQND